MFAIVEARLYPYNFHVDRVRDQKGEEGLTSARDAIDTAALAQRSWGGQRFMMPVRQLARLNFGTPSWESTATEFRFLSLSSSLPLLPVEPRMRDKEKATERTKQKKKREKKVDEIRVQERGAELIRLVRRFPRIRASASVPTVLCRKIVSTSDPGSVRQWSNYCN